MKHWYLLHKNPYHSVSNSCLLDEGEAGVQLHLNRTQPPIYILDQPPPVIGEVQKLDRQYFRTSTGTSRWLHSAVSLLVRRRRRRSSNEPAPDTHIASIGPVWRCSATVDCWWLVADDHMACPAGVGAQVFSGLPGHTIVLWFHCRQSGMVQSHPLVPITWFMHSDT